ncbi:MAG: hypothetical protein M5U34_42825 [Chloroflexi bacterium]|nr:hypothetical protein [Chloroflexota bacterium]
MQFPFLTLAVQGQRCTLPTPTLTHPAATGSLSPHSWLITTFWVSNTGRYGPDSQPAELTSWRVIGDDLSHFLTQQKLHGVVGVGHSLGAVATLYAAVQRLTCFGRWRWWSRSSCRHPFYKWLPPILKQPRRSFSAASAASTPPLALPPGSV